MGGSGCGPIANGAATWFCCGVGGFPGTCCNCPPRPNPSVCQGCGQPSRCSFTGGPDGACCNSPACDKDVPQAAWQRLSGHGGTLCNFTGPWRSCGDRLCVGSMCRDEFVSVIISTKGPGSCSGANNDCYGWTNKVIDLTPAAFAAIADLSNGIASVRVCDGAGPC